MCVIHGVMFFRCLHLLDAPGCLDSIGTYSLSMFYLHNKVMNDRAATARRVGSKDCNLSWSILQEWKKNESEREREREGEGEEGESLIMCKKVIEGKHCSVVFLAVQQEFSGLMWLEAPRVQGICIWMLSAELWPCVKKFRGTKSFADLMRLWVTAVIFGWNWGMVLLRKLHV